jgi:hypothetical protein
MPKIFLIKNRLHMQQQRLLESQKRMELEGGSENNGDGGVALAPPGSLFSPSEDVDCEPLSLIVEKPTNVKGKPCTQCTRPDPCVDITKLPDSISSTLPVFISGQGKGDVTLVCN